ncbi:MAG: class I SAM-dependent methyltransferase [Magnetococcales bacterium]|uniref:Class I SAM-dependent methyltransferase n=2 Tax=Candidatus Magnetobacterium casense TaxID=1455061 RepID=A0ABS6S4X6_9BACT|nr:class I SAM-dependent methyltransferase [Nitrospirota bacterium]MBV6343720.1 class I SAM-dependent methyltransferase [Candidatus Magnetobacterium casensis]
MSATTQVQLTDCPVCNGTSFKRLFNNVVRCLACNLIFVNPQPTDEQLRGIYTQQYYASWGLGTDYDSVREMKVATFDTLLKIAERYFSGGKVLDVGCATGFFLEAASHKGFSAYGVELSEYSASIARDRFGSDRVFHGSLEGAGYEDGFFDAVFMIDLIEHIKDVNALLREVYRILRVGGVLVIVTPDIKSVTFRLMGRHWPHFKTEHLFYFSTSTLKKLCAGNALQHVTDRPARKALSLRYVENQLSAYKVPVILPLVRMVNELLPDNLRRRKFMTPMGELLFIARKTHDKATETK